MGHNTDRLAAFVSKSTNWIANTSKTDRHCLLAVGFLCCPSTPPPLKDLTALCQGGEMS